MPSQDELQDEGDRMEFNQHAGLYVLLAVGIFLCVMLMLLEHATFKWLVPYWRRKPKDSFWKSMSMMFWSQVCYCQSAYPCMTSIMSSGNYSIMQQIKVNMELSNMEKVKIYLMDEHIHIF